MGRKKRRRNPLPEWAKEFLPPPGVELQVYRQRRDDPKKWKYLGKLEPEFQVDLENLEARHPMELEELVPFDETQQRWGGGYYQFRFIWRDEEGRKRQKRSLNFRIAPPLDQW